jgi:hypothetical protein
VGIANTTGINADVTYSSARRHGPTSFFLKLGIGNDNAGSARWRGFDSATIGKWKERTENLRIPAALIPDRPRHAANALPGLQIKTSKQRASKLLRSLVAADLWRTGGLEVIVDPYALKKSGQVELTFNALVDMLVRQPLSFNVSTDTAAA